MPNWCYTSYVFHGKRNEIMEFRDKIEEWTSEMLKPNGFGEAWLGNILVGAGLKHRINSYENRLRCRGSIVNMSTREDIYGDEDDYCFDLQTETAWCPMPQMWVEVIKVLGYDSIKFSFQSEEKGMVEYSVWDPFGDFLEKFYVDIWLGEKDKDNVAVLSLREGPYIDSDESVRLILQRLLGSEKDDLDELIKDAEGYPFKDDDSYIRIHRYETWNPEYWC